MQDRKGGGFYYLQIGHLPHILAEALLQLTRRRIDNQARITRDRRAIETRLPHRAELEQLARDITPAQDLPSAA